MRNLYEKHKEKIRFGLVGGANTILDFGIYGLLANWLGVPVLAANMISTAACMVVSFLLNYNFVWQSKKSKRETAPRFVTVSLFSAWVVQTVIIFLVVGILGKSEMSEDLMNLGAKVLAVGGGMVTNYCGYKYIFA